MNLKKNACFLPLRNRRLYHTIIFFLLFCSALTVQGQTISITASVSTRVENNAAPGNFVRFTVRKGSFAMSRPNFRVFYSISGSAVNGADYGPIASSVVISGAAPVQTAIINVPLIDDALVEGNENIILTLEPGAYTITSNPNLSSAQATIVDDDTSTVTVSATDPNAAENTPANQIGTFTIDLGAVNSSDSQINVSFLVDPSSTAAPADYNGAGGNAFVLPGDQTVDVSIQPIDDTLIEGDETLTITLDDTSLPSSFIVQPNTSASIVIADNDCSAGNTAPVLNTNSPDFCDVASVNLNTFFDGTAPAGAPLRWSTVANPPTAAQLLTPAQASSATANTYYAVFWSNAQTCASPSAGPLTITINESPEAGTANPGLFGCTDEDNGSTLFDLDDAITGADPGGIWSSRSAPPGADPITPNAQNVVDFDDNETGNYVFRYTVAGAGACPNDFVDVTISVSDCDPCIAGNVAPILNPAEPTIFCGAIVADLNDYTTSMPPAGTTLRWSNTAPTGDNIPAAIATNITQGGTYFGYFFDATNDCASPALRITITQNTAPMITNSAGGTRCGPGPVTFTATATGNATFNWYTMETGGAVAGTGANFTTNLNQTRTFYLEATENGCPTIPRVPVTGTVLIQPTTGTPATGVSSCNNSAFGTTTLDLDTTLDGEDAGSWVFTSGPVNVPLNAENIVDFSTRPNGNYIYTFTTTGAEAPCTNESVAVSISVSSCDTDADGDGLLGGLEATLGTDPNDVDSDNDLINDDVEVGADTDNPLDIDEDGIIDALDSNLADSDGDGVVDQLDPANNNACIPDNTNGNCDEPIDLEVIKIVDNPNAVVGDEITFTITVNNLGPRTANTIVIGDFLESGFEYMGQNASRGTYDPDTGQWQLIDLATGTSATLSITAAVVADENQMYSNTAELLSSDPLDSNQDNDSSTVTLGVEQPEGINLVIEKTVRLEPETRRLKEVTGLINDIENTLTVEYFIKVTNKSQGGTVSNISVRDEFVNDSDVVFEIIDSNVPDGSSFNATNGSWSISRGLDVGEEIELSYTVEFESEGTVVNTAQIIAPQETDPENTDSTSSATVVITVRNDQEIGILYNQFSPNSDGINDVLKVNRLRKNELGIDELVNIEYSIEIFNRYGNKVFEAAGLNEEEAWDGTWKGKQVPDGTYFYGLSVTIEGEPDTKNSKGWIQLIR